MWNRISNVYLNIYEHYVQDFKWDFMENIMWSELDNVQEELKAKFNADSITLDSIVIFNRPFNKIAAGTKAVVLEKQQSYYALAVKGQYIEGVHRSFLNLEKL